jgi:hypothetical protein
VDLNLLVHLVHLRTFQVGGAGGSNTSDCTQPGMSLFKISTHRPRCIALCECNTPNHFE